MAEQERQELLGERQVRAQRLVLVLVLVLDVQQVLERQLGLGRL